MVFGVGLPRTGTSSLTKAMQILGYRSAHRKTRSGRITRHDISKYDFLADIPVCGWYDDSDLEGKFILTVRDPLEWYESYVKMQYKVWGGAGPWPLDFAAYLCYEKTLGFSLDRTELLQRFEKHTYDVLTHRPDALVFKTGEHGWKELCAFLNEPIPEIPYPWINKNGIITDAKSD